MAEKSLNTTLLVNSKMKGWFCILTVDKKRENSFNWFVPKGENFNLNWFLKQMFWRERERPKCSFDVSLLDISISVQI